MKIFIGILVFLLICIIAVAIILVLAKDFIIKTAIEQVVELITGLKLKIDSVKISFAQAFVRITGLRLFNPPGYKDNMMIDMPEVYVQIDVEALQKEKIHLPEARLNLKEFTVVKNDKGELNVNALKAVKEKTEAAKPKEEKPAPKQEMPEMRIDRLQLKIGKVVYKDYSKGDKPDVKEFNINIDETYENITDPQALIRLIIMKVMMDTALGKILNFDVTGLMKGLPAKLPESLKGIADISGKSAGTAVETTKTITEKTGEVTADTVEKTAETIKNIFTMGGETKETAK